MKKYSLLQTLIILLAGLVLVACSRSGTTGNTQPAPSTPASTLDTTCSTQASLPALPYVVVDEDLVACFESSGPNESRHGVNPLTLVNSQDSFHVLEVTTRDENTFPAYLWYKIENPKDSGTTCWLPATSVHLVGDLGSVQAADIPPTPPGPGKSPSSNHA